MLVTLKELLDEAKVEHKAVGAFNGTTLEAIRGIIQAAEELNSPVILQHAQSHDDLIDLEEIGPVMKYYAERAKVPVALHLDHGSSFDRCVQALKLGFTSVMYDASAKSFEENAAETAEIVKIAHAVGASVEAELGHIFTSKVVQGEGAGADSTDDYEDLDNIYTDPEVAKKFVEMTNVDCLAVAFGTTHGVYLTEPKLDLPRVARLREATNIPLVMHGGSGVSDEDYAVAIENGICKVNYYTYMNTASTSVFSDVKNAISTRQAAELYGFAVNRNGMMCCPFHGDKHPPMLSLKPVITSSKISRELYFSVIFQIGRAHV